MRRVAVTGIGLISPLGAGVGASWERLLAGQSGVRKIEHFDTSDLPAKIAGQVPRGKEPGQYDPLSLVSAKEVRRFDDFMLFAIAATEEAVTDAGWKSPGDEDSERTGVLIGSGIGGIASIAENAVRLHEEGPRRISPFFITGSLINEASGVVSMRYGFKGPNHAVVTACATGAHAIGDAARLIALGDADVMIAGGTEAATCRLTLASFCIMRAMSTGYNDRPEEASRPWDRARDGFVIGEGAGILVLEEMEHAKKRGAHIHAELLGYGLSGDAHHLSAPDPAGSGARRAMKAALKRAGVTPEEVDYVNAHATSTPVGDPVEIEALKSCFGSHAYEMSVSSTKSATGHLLGAAGAAEAIFTVLSVRDGAIPPTLNLESPDAGCDLDLVPHQPKERCVRHALSNSFGFGGTNASLVFGRVS